MPIIRGKESKRLLDSLLADAELAKDISVLPANYNFELPKTIWRIKTTTGSKHVALQFPEGLLLYACRICDIIAKHVGGGVRTLIMGDITYGACCVDDLTAKELGCDMLVHYGHSCLVPISETPGIVMLYVFVDIDINVSKLVGVVKENFAPGSKLALVSTVQFVRALQELHKSLTADGYVTLVPQCKPLSPGEVLGCTSPKLPADCDALIYVGDGRFHLESAMIQNPAIAAYQYDPYSGAFTREHFDFDKMLAERQRSIDAMAGAKVVGVILGTLGRQGSTKVYDALNAKLGAAGKETLLVLMSEIFPEKLALFHDVDIWVQVACPRLSIDWGSAFAKPVLTPYECFAALGDAPCPRRCNQYPMDYYANDNPGPWGNNSAAHAPVT